MPEQTKSADASDLCMEASYRMYERLRALCERIEALPDPYISPEDPLPVDKFLSNMPERKNSPEVIFQPPLLRSELWTKNLTCYVYASLEQAFVTAGNVPGKDRSGQGSELRALLKWVDEQLNDPQRSIPDDFFHRTTYVFSKSYLIARSSIANGSVGCSHRRASVRASIQNRRSASPNMGCGMQHRSVVR